jgi:tetratricopeptide (TPR) repeat protein
MAELPSSNRRLETWKEVAAYLGKNERTVKRWEAERGLPVHRLPGESRSRIHAHPVELDAWLKGIGGGSIPVEAPLAPRRPLMTVGLATLVVAGIVGVAALATWTRSTRTPAAGRAAAARSIPPPPVEAQRLYVEATEAWGLRTPASLNVAQAKFNGAIQRDPDYAEAYAGLAKTYLLLREYTALPESEAYTKAKSAAERALALNDNLPEGHAALAFVAANWLWDPKQAEREYRRAIALDPRNPTVRHWFGTFLLDQARPAESMKELDTSLAMDPGSSSVEADRALVLDYLGRPAAAIAELHQLEAASPQYKSPHEYLARIYFESGRDKEFFDEGRRAARLTDDLPRLAMIEAGERAFTRGGHRAALLAIRDVQIRQLQYGDGRANAVALTDAMLGDDAEACRYLQLSRRLHEPSFASAPASPGFARLRSAGSCDAIALPLHA